MTNSEKTRLDGTRFAQAGVMLALREIRLAIAEEPLLAPQRAAAARNAVLGRVSHYHFSEALQLAEVDPRILASPNDSLTECCRLALRAIIEYTSIPWASLLLGGTTVLHDSLQSSSRNVLQCFDYARLFDNSESAFAWWDAVDGLVRAHEDAKKAENGRIGERLTMEHEEERLRVLGRNDLKPVWIARQDAYAGYDVQSFRIDDGGNVQKSYIECKACQQPPLSFHLSPNEVKTARLRSEAFLIHLWNLQRRTVTMIQTKDIEEHLPVNNGSGKWQDVRISWAIG